jgi:hypothetical protein
MPRSWAINQVVGTVGAGIEVILLSVESWPSRLVLSLAARHNETTQKLTSEWHGHLDEWRKSGFDGQPPKDPSTVLLQDLGVTVRDPTNHRYALVGCHAGGQDNEWAATRIFTRGPATRNIVLCFNSVSGSREILIPEEDPATPGTQESQHV